MNRKVTPWEILPKRMIWSALSHICGKTVLDYGSGTGLTSDHFAKNNSVVAIEPDGELLKDRFMDHPYTQINGSLDELKSMESQSFDVILCHCVLEYIDDKQEILTEFIRILKPGGQLSIVKHNRPGRVMQMVVLLNKFQRANELLDGNDDKGQYGAIRYYNDDDIEKWFSNLCLVSLTGLRCFWHLQQNQDIHNDITWQDEMIAIEEKVSTIKVYIDIAMFHHLIYTKRD